MKWIVKPNPRYALAISEEQKTIPTSIKETLKKEDQRAAMHKEYELSTTTESNMGACSTVGVGQCHK